MQNVFVPQSDSVQNLLLELRNEIISLKTEVVQLKHEIKELKDENTKAITKLTEEVISVKLENRKHHSDAIITDQLADSQKLPFDIIADLEHFNLEIQQNEDKLKQFVRIIVRHID